MTVEPHTEVLSLEAALEFMGAMDLFSEIAAMLLDELPGLMELIPTPPTASSSSSRRRRIG
jgi:hypothetical protein